MVPIQIPRADLGLGLLVVLWVGDVAVDVVLAPGLEVLLVLLESDPICGPVRFQPLFHIFPLLSPHLSC